MQASNASNSEEDYPNLDIASLCPSKTKFALDETNPTPDKACSGLQETSLNLNMGIDFELESWAKNKIGESSDPDNIPKE